MKDETINAIAAKHGVSAAQVCLRWTNQRGVATMPFSLKENEMKENLDIWKLTLDEEDMADYRCAFGPELDVCRGDALVPSTRLVAD